jgi:hypothetical protein
MRKLLRLTAASLIVFTAFILPLRPVRTAEIGKVGIAAPKQLEKAVLASYKHFDTTEKVPVTVQDWAVIWLDKYGWSDQWSCLNSLIMGESGWNIHSTNVSSGAYGIGQALPGSKMSVAGADWQDNPSTQLHWMMMYLQANHGGTPCSNWAFWQNPTSPPYDQHWY